MTTRVITLWRERVTSLTTSVITMRYLHEIMHNLKAIKIRNRFLLTVIRCLIYQWLEVSREVDKSRARSVSDIFTDD